MATDVDNLDLWSGHQLKETNVTDVGQAILEAHRKYWVGVEMREAGVIRQSARWLRSIASAMDKLADSSEE